MRQLSDEERYEARQEYAEELVAERRARKARGCACGLDGYPGRCPGAENCPYSGFRDDDEGEQ